MFGFSSESAWKRIRDLEGRVTALEERDLQARLDVMETVDRVSYRLAERERKRAAQEQDFEDPVTPPEATDGALGYSRRFANRDR